MNPIITLHGDFLRITTDELLETIKDLVILARQSKHPNYMDGCTWCSVAFHRASLIVTDLERTKSL